MSAQDTKEMYKMFDSIVTPIERFSVSNLVSSLPMYHLTSLSSSIS